MSDVIIAVVGVVSMLTIAGLGAMTGYRLSHASRSERRRGLIVVLVLAIFSPVLHGAAIFVWAGLVGGVGAYIVGRQRQIRDSG